jgi:hypothetical protein
MTGGTCRPKFRHYGKVSGQGSSEKFVHVDTSWSIPNHSHIRHAAATQVVQAGACDRSVETDERNAQAAGARLLRQNREVR